MNQKKFLIVLLSVLAVCALITVALLVFTFKQYGYISIIRFIARERW